jgi:small-conductance mechanosensitive channel
MDINLDSIKTQALEYIDILIKWASSPKFYAQIAAIIVAVILALFIAKQLKKRVDAFRNIPQEGPRLKLRQLLYATRDLVFPIVAILLLAIAVSTTKTSVGQSWLVVIAQGLAVILFLHTVITRFIKTPFINALFLWIGIPLATLYVFGWLDDVTQALDGMALQLGNIHLSAFALLRIAIFGTILFWLGGMSRTAGTQAIRSKETLDSGTKEIFAKLFEMGLFFILFMVLLQIAGISLTTLAVFGGALGVGLGFGLQQIAANFISGMIILLDRSVTVGDYIELEDGRTGTITQMNMRSSSLDTYDGKSIVVPNEQFITTAFTNWTHKDTLQRYTVEFSVSYNTDIPKVPELILAAIRQHPQVLEEPEKPDCEIIGFGESGVDFHVEYWMDGIDDGQNRVDSDLMLIIWNTLKENNIEIPFPQREVRILNDSGVTIKKPVRTATAAKKPTPKK